MYNTIILTSGLTGSSVLTGLLARGGFWAGDRTAKKKDYDTFENEELIRLIANRYEVPKSRVRIRLGLSSRNKVVEIE